MNRLFGLVLLALVGVGAMTGCQPSLRPGLLNDAAVYYERGDYDQAFAAGRAVARQGEPSQQGEGALIAGLAAQQNGDLRTAEQYLRQAAASDQPEVAGDALASLGLVYAQQERYSRSAAALVRAAEFLQGQPRANAYFYAAVAQQKLGRWAQARTNLVLARSSSRDPQFRQQVSDQIDVVGWTLQLGAFRDQDNAHQRAQQLAQRTREARLGVPRVLRTTDRNGQPLSVVQVGQFTTFQSASQARDRLGENSTIIVPLASQ